ncbi:MAG: translation initiation factor IF-2 [Candidatus Nealsonbacteria bacterium]
MASNTLQSNIVSRPPIVVVMGHVDHGKSSLLEAIKGLKITAKESGGITQHIGAYEVEHSSAGSGQAKKITFLDTPGHEAFSAMRSRGAKVADIAILVVDAEESVKPQTKEAILHIQKSGIPMIVAINKIDKPGSNPEKVKRDLVQSNVLVESMGGKVPHVLTSAKDKKGINELLEIILLVAEMEELKGDIAKPAEGVVVESYLDNQRGPIATVILRDGILRKGDIVAAFPAFGKVKSLEDFQGVPREEGLPSMPCVINGFEAVPQVGEKFEVCPDIESAQKHLERKEKRLEGSEMTLIEGDRRVLNIVLKADVQGSIEAIREVLKSLPQEKVVLRILKGEAGEIQEGDVRLAKDGKAKVIGFRVKINVNAQKLAERENVSITSFDVIYHLAQGVRVLMERRTAPEKMRTDLGKLKILIVFLNDKNRQIVGGKIIEGEIKKGTQIEVLRDNEVIGKGRPINLQKNKKDIERAVKGDEAGVLYEGDVKIEQGDILQFYLEEKKKVDLEF